MIISRSLVSGIKIKIFPQLVYVERKQKSQNKEICVGEVGCTGERTYVVH